MEFRKFSVAGIEYGLEEPPESESTPTDTNAPKTGQADATEPLSRTPETANAPSTPVSEMKREEGDSRQASSALGGDVQQKRSGRHSEGGNASGSNGTQHTGSISEPKSTSSKTILPHVRFFDGCPNYPGRRLLGPDGDLLGTGNKGKNKKGTAQRRNLHYFLLHLVGLKLPVRKAEEERAVPCAFPSLNDDTLCLHSNLLLNAGHESCSHH